MSELCLAGRTALAVADHRGTETNAFTGNVVAAKVHVQPVQGRRGKVTDTDIAPCINEVRATCYGKERAAVTTDISPYRTVEELHVAGVEAQRAGFAHSGVRQV